MSEKAKGKRRAVSPDPQTGSTADLGLRMRLLKRNHDLQSLHAELVLTGQITEDEFWDGREYMLQAQQQEESQKQGRTGQMADPKPQTGDGGEVKITVTPQLIADIFAQYPVVQKAYNENCPPVSYRRLFLSCSITDLVFSLLRANFGNATFSPNSSTATEPVLGKLMTPLKTMRSSTST